MSVTESFRFPYAHKYESVGYEHVLGDIFDNWRTACGKDYMEKHNLPCARIDRLPVGSKTPPGALGATDGSVIFVDLTTHFNMDGHVSIEFLKFNDKAPFHGLDPHWEHVDCIVIIDYSAKNVVGPATLFSRDEIFAGDMRLRVIEAMKVARRKLSPEPRRSIFATIAPSHGPGEKRNLEVEPSRMGAA